MGLPVGIEAEMWGPAKRIKDSLEKRCLKPGLAGGGCARATATGAGACKGAPRAAASGKDLPKGGGRLGATTGQPCKAATCPGALAAL